MGPRWIAAVVMFFLMCTLISNILENQQIYTQEQVASIQAMKYQQFTEAKEPDIGGVVTTGENPLTVIGAIWQALKLEYSFLYDVDYTMTEAECNAYAAVHPGGVGWNANVGACQMPNIWWTLWLIMIYGPMVAIAFYFALQLWKAVTGRG